MDFISESLAECILAKSYSVLCHGRTNGNPSTGELSVISSLVAKAKPARAFEFGTFNGLTAMNIAMNQKEKSILYTLNLSLGEKPLFSTVDEERKYFPRFDRKSYFLGTPLEGRIIQISQDSALLDTSKYKEMDFVFVDGAHSYEYCLNDSQKAFEMISPGGIIVWHDYDKDAWPGVSRYLDELAPKRRLFRLCTIGSPNSLVAFFERFQS